MTLRSTVALVTVTAALPVALANVAWTCAAPLPTAVTSPDGVTVATAASEDDHSTVAWSITVPLADRTVAVNWSVSPRPRIAGDGETSTCAPASQPADEEGRRLQSGM